MKHRTIQLFASLIIFSLLCTGCSTQQTAKEKTKSTHVHHEKKNKNDSKKDSKTDGTVISMKKIQIPNMIDPNVTPYRMMYWSNGTKTEAYVAAPPSGQYPLFINCHGGYVEPLKKTHVSEVGNVHYGKEILKNASNRSIAIAPMYRGYGHSEGTINGIYGNTIDTENAIKAVISYAKAHKNFPDIEKGHTYVFGVSMGGGVALRLASERKDILSVVALSPFVGWDIVGSWDKKHNPTQLYEAIGYFNKSFDPKNPTYKKQSVPYKKITAPTLLIQGKKDKTVPWQTVKILYKKMKANHQKVTLKLVKGGNHALTNKEHIVNKYLISWNNKHWVN